MARRRVLALLLLALVASGCGRDAGGEGLLVFAAASLADVGPELGEAFAVESGIPVNFSFGSSAALARQVAAGAPADVLLSADVGLRDEVLPRMPHDRAQVSFARNELVTVVPTGAPWPARGLRGVERIAVGDWEAAVPVGRRAAAWLFARGLWEELRPHLLPAADARATLAAVASGAADAGIVYATDAASTDRVRVVERAGADGPAVLYVAFELSEGEGAARDFVRFLVREPAGAILERHGFVVAGTPPGRRGERFPG